MAKAKNSPSAAKPSGKKPVARRKQRSPIPMIIGFVVVGLIVVGAAIGLMVAKLVEKDNGNQVAVVDDQNVDQQTVQNEDEPQQDTNANSEPEINQPAIETNAATASPPNTGTPPETVANVPATNQPNTTTTTTNTVATPPMANEPPTTSTPPEAPETTTEATTEAPSEQPLLPTDRDRFEALLGETVTFEGELVMATESGSKKTKYLRFSRDWDQTIMVFMLVRNVGEDWTVDALNNQFGNKKIRVTGLVERQFGTNRLGVKVISKDQIQIVE